MTDHRLLLHLKWHFLACREPPNLNLNPEIETGLQSADCKGRQSYLNQQSRDWAIAVSPHANQTS